MKTTARTARLVPALAVAAVSIAALAATAATLIAQRGSAPSRPQDVHAQAQPQRPRADEPVSVVRAPRDAQLRRERML